jgi:hypothetical protein
MGKPFANAVAVGEAVAAAFPQRHFLATWPDSRLPIPLDRVKALAIALLHDVMFWSRGN